jgi:hypothetical protein
MVSSTEVEMNTLEGQCYCGKVKYAVEKPLKFVAHDHCSICRRISGAPFVTWSGVKSEQFKLLTGKDDLTEFQSTKEATRQFCRHCGSHLFFRSTRWPGEVHFTLATITSKEVDPPKAHVFFSDKAEWIKTNDDLPKFGGVTGTEKL